MTAVADQSRFRNILEAAREAFIENAGFRRTQMADVARRLGIAPGTLYLYVSSKEALFEAAVLAANDSDWVLQQSTPYDAAPLADFIDIIRAQIESSVGGVSTLAEAVASNRSGNYKELRAICGELYDLTARYRYVIRLVEACAADFPDLAAVYWTNGRIRITEMLVSYFKNSERVGGLRTVADPLSSARHIIETNAFWAVHRFWDPSPMNFDESTVRENAIEFASAPFKPVGQDGSKKL